MGNTYETLLDYISEKSLSNLEIGLMAVAYWMIESPGMSDEHLQDILQRIGYTFNITTKIFSDGTNNLTINDMLAQTIENIYPSARLTPPALRLTIKKAFNKGYIAEEQKNVLIGKL